jgi:hypothetical protein
MSSVRTIHHSETRRQIAALKILPDEYSADNHADNDQHDAQFDEREAVIFAVSPAHMLPDFPPIVTNPGYRATRIHTAPF